MAYELTEKNLENLFAGLDTDNNIATGYAAEYNSLKTKFKGIINNAQNHYTTFDSNESNYLLSSLIDNKNDPDLIINGNDLQDMLLIDNYKVDGIKNININATEFKIGGKTYKGFKVKITGEDGILRNYNLTNVEKLRFVDTSGNLQELDIKSGKLGLSKNTTTKPEQSGYYHDLKKEWGISKFSDKADSAELDGKGVSFNTGGGDDFVTVNALGSAKDPDQVNGGAGIDTIYFKNMTEADIKSITYNEKTLNYTLTDKAGKAIQFKRFEKIKIGNNIYDIKRPDPKNKENILTLENRFVGGSVHFSYQDSELLKKGVYFGDKDDWITIDKDEALNYNFPNIIDGGGGTNTLDLHSLGNASITKWKVDDQGVYTILLSVDGYPRELKLKNIDKIRLNLNGVDTTKSINELGQLNDQAVDTYYTIGTDETRYYDFSSLSIDDGTDDYSNYGDANNNFKEILKLEGSYEDYSFENWTLFQRPNNIGAIKVKNLKTGKILYINKGIDAVQFTDLPSAPVYRLVGLDGQYFGNNTKFDANTKKLSISTENLDGNPAESILSTDDLIYATNELDYIKAYNGNDTIFVNSLNIITSDQDTYDGGEGNDTLDLSGLSGAKIINWEYDSTNSQYKIKIQSGGVENTLSIKNIENIKIKDGSTIKNIKVSETELAKIAPKVGNEQSTTVGKPVSENIINNLNWTEDENGNNIISGEKGKIDLLKLEGKLSDYRFEFYPGASTGADDDYILISKFNTTSNKDEYIRIKAVDAIQFKDGPKYRLLNLYNEKFGDIDLTAAVYGNTYQKFITFGSNFEAEDLDLSYAQSFFGFANGNIYLGSDSIDEIIGGIKDDTFMESLSDDSFDLFDGGEGTDTLILDNNVNDYKISYDKNTGLFELSRKDGDGGVTRFKNIENLIFQDDVGAEQKFTIKDFWEKANPGITYPI